MDLMSNFLKQHACFGYKRNRHLIWQWLCFRLENLLAFESAADCKESLYCFKAVINCNSNKDIPYYSSAQNRNEKSFPVEFYQSRCNPDKIKGKGNKGANQNENSPEIFYALLEIENHFHLHRRKFFNYPASEITSGIARHFSKRGARSRRNSQQNRIEKPQPRYCNENNVKRQG